MLSRVAEAIYWASRYVERAENVARFVNVNLDLMLDSPMAQRPSWQPLVFTSGDQVAFEEHYSDYSPQSVTQFLTFDRNYGSSIYSSIRSARENARTVREVISREMWEEINSLYLAVREARRANQSAEEMASFYEQVKMAGIRYAGATDATLSHGEAWHFSRLGRMLERADKTSRIVDVKYFSLQPDLASSGTAVAQVGWTALLNSASALQMYRQKYHTISPDRVARFLLLSSSFPRSVRHCVHRMQESIHNITGTPVGGFKDEAERLIGLLRTRLDYTDCEQIIRFGLHEFLGELQGTMNGIGSEVQERFFSVDKDLKSRRVSPAPLSLSSLSNSARAVD